MNEYIMLPETHKLKIHLIFHQIQLTVKFQCSIVLALKNQNNKVISETTPKSLSQGKCQISQQILIDWEAQYNPSTSEYLPSTMEISVLVHATNGVIHAGLCTLDVTKSFHQSVFPLKKCCDKTATLTLTSTAQYSQTVLKINNNIKNFSNAEISHINHSKNRKISRFKSEENRLSESRYEQSILSISKISATSNKKVQNFLRGENQEISKENDELRQKVKCLQRKEKQNTQQMKEFLIKIQKITNRCSEAEGLNQLNEMLLNQKEKCIKSYENQINRLQQRNKDYFEQINALEAKLDTKEEHLSKQNDKYIGKVLKLEQQLQVVTKSYTSVLSKYEQYERNIILSNKQKQKSIQLQRAKTRKYIKQLEDKMQQLQQQKQIYKFKFMELENQTERLKKSLSFISNLNDKDQTIQNMNIQLSEIKKQKMQIQQELNELKFIQEDRLCLKKKITELLSQCNVYKMQLKKINQSGQNAQKKFEDLYAKVDKLQRVKKGLDFHLQNLKTDFNLKKNQLLIQQKQNRELKDQIKRLQTFVKSQKMKKQDLLVEQQHAIYILKQQIFKIESDKQMLQYQRVHIKQQLEKKTLQNQQLILKIHNLNQQHQIKNEYLINYESDFKTKQEELFFFFKKIDLLQNQQKKSKQSIKKLQNQIKILKDTIQTHQRKIQTIESLKVQNQYYQNSLLNMQKQLQQKNKSNKKVFLWLFDIIQSEKPINQTNKSQIQDQLIQDFIKSIKKRNMLLEKRQNDYGILIQQKHFIQNQLQKLGRRLYQCEQYYQEELLREKQERETQLKDFIEEKNKLLESIIEMETQKIQLTTLKEKYYKDNKLQQHRVEAYQEDLERLKNINIQLQKKVKSEHQNLLEMTKYYEKIFGHTEIQQKQFQKEKEQIYQVQKQKNQSFMKTLEDIIKRKQVENKILHQKIKQLEEKLSEQQSQQKKIEFDLSMQIHLFQELQITYSELSRLNNDLKVQLKKLQIEFQSNQKQISEKQIDLHQHSAKSIELQDRLGEAQQIITNYVQKKSQLDHILEKKNQQIEELKQKIKALEKEYNGEKKKIQEQKNKLMQEVSIYKILMQQAQNTIDRLQKEKEQLLLKTKQSQLQ